MATKNLPQKKATVKESVKKAAPKIFLKRFNSSNLHAQMIERAKGYRFQFLGIKGGNSGIISRVRADFDMLISVQIAKYGLKPVLAPSDDLGWIISDIGCTKAEIAQAKKKVAFYKGMNDAILKKEKKMIEEAKALRKAEKK